MPKPIAIRLKDWQGKVYTWKIERVPRAVNCTLGRKNRVVSGWQYSDENNYPRFVEGNWRELVERVHLTAENYGLELMSELS